MRDLGFEAADDAAETDGVLGVGDDDGVRIDPAHLAVEALHRFVGFPSAHDDGIAVQSIEIEGVQRMAEGDHHVVGGVDDVVDWAEAGFFETALDLGG